MKIKNQTKNHKMAVFVKDKNNAVINKILGKIIKKFLNQICLIFSCKIKAIYNRQKTVKKTENLIGHQKVA